MNQKQERLFKELPVWRDIFTMAVPAVINILVMVLYNMADMFFVARLHDDVQVASISIVAPAFTMMMALGSMVGGGGCALIAQTMGEGDSDRVSLYSSLCCWGSVMFGVIFAVVVLFGKNAILGFLGANEEMWSYAGTYLSILALGAPVMIFTTAFGNIVRAEGAVKEGMVGNLISTVTNMVLDPLFILVLPFGVSGAAVATVLGNLAGAGYLIRYVQKKSSSLSLSPKLAAAAPFELRQVVAIGLPNGTSSFLTSFASALANNLMVQYGTLAVAAMAAASKSTTIITMVQMGICVGVQPLLAYSCGAKDLTKLRETLGKLAILTMSVGLAATLLCFCFSAPIISVFLKRPEALSLGQEIIRIRVLTGPFIGLFYIGSNFLQASGNAPLSMLVSLLRQGIFLIPFYDLCDENGIVAWAEIPYITQHMEEGRDNTLTQMRELVTQCYNHPSIVCWGLSNEITASSAVTEDMLDNHRALNGLCHRLDPTRPTAMANVFMLETDSPILDIPDVNSYNLYFGWYLGDLEQNEEFFDAYHAKYPDRPMGFSEYGADANPRFQAAPPERGDYSEQYQCVYHEHILKLIEARPWLWATHVWNLFDFAADGRDEGGKKGKNQKGLVTFDRKIRKDAFYLYKAAWSREPFVHLCGSRYVNRAEEVTKVKVYSNQRSVSLLVDGKPFATQTGKTVFTFQVPISGEHTPARGTPGTAKAPLSSTSPPY